MNLKHLQNQVDDRIWQFKEGYFPTLWLLTQLIEETWEIARVLAFEEKYKNPKIGEKIEPLGRELADLLFSVICMANAKDIDLDTEWNNMMEERIYKRDKNRYTKKNE